MCGIVAYVGKTACKDFILEGLSRLEYRGYDSAGFVCIDNHHKHFSFAKEVGRVSLLRATVDASGHDGSIGMGHTRWATHGAADKKNAHPHFDCQKSIAVVHNGIIEGYAQLREQLKAEGHEFYSTTDTEVAAHMLGKLIAAYKETATQNPDYLLHDAVVALVAQLSGAYALVFMLEEYPDTLIAIRRRSPLVIGVGDGEMFVASDPLACADRTNQMLFMPDDSFAFVKKDSLKLYDFSGALLVPHITTTNIQYNESSKNGYEHFMLKEIYEQKRAIENSLAFYQLIDGQTPSTSHEDSIRPAYRLSRVEDEEGIWAQLGVTSEQIKQLNSFNMIAAGTSWHAARIGQFFFEQVCKLPTTVSLSSEFRSMPFFDKPATLYCALTQSGETADTLEALRMIIAEGAPTIALTNVASSTIVREAGGTLLMQAGQEISVASTKAFSTQIASLYWLAHRMALTRGQITLEQFKQAQEELMVTAEVLHSCIDQYKWPIINAVAGQYARYEQFIFLGRHISYPFALEAALKLKEISYRFVEAQPAGELKHGPIALIDEGTPVFIFSLLNDAVYHKLVSNAQEVKARKGHLTVFAFEGQSELMALADQLFVIPRVPPLLAPLGMTGVMQFLIYQITKELGRPIDMPRNLAKSVTVE